MLRLNDISFSYDGNEFINNLNIDINHKKFISIIGPNGSGKSTLIKILTNNIKDYKGDIFYFKKNIKKYTVKEFSKITSYIGQKNNIKFPYTALELVLMGRTPHKTLFESYSKEDFEICKKYMQMTDCYEFCDRLITNLSGGEYQRVLFARSLVQRTKILFLDESFSAMDISYKIKCFKLLKKLIKEEDLSVISIMHDINFAYKYSDEILLMKDGQIYKFGDTKNIMNEENINYVFNTNLNFYEDKGFFLN
ncbi:ABC transporter ATP-binding protein [Peptostreptococcaceae bacterium AGR-M142]